MLSCVVNKLAKSTEQAKEGPGVTSAKEKHCTKRLIFLRNCRVVVHRES